jgi:hypothetical protein
MDFERRIAASTELLRAPILIIQPFASFATFCSNLFLPSVKAELTLSAPSRSSSNPLLPLLPSVQISFTFCKSRTYPVGTFTVIIQPFASFATFCSNLFYLL